jgi:hypothetical protein
MPRKAQAKTKPKLDAPRRRSQCAFKRSDVTRAVRAAQDANLPIGSVVIEGGRITIIPKSDAPQQGNSWDDVTNVEDTKRAS